MLLTRIPAASTYSPFIALCREDYPKVWFWTRQEWNSVMQVPVLVVDEEGEVFPELDEEEEGSREPPRHLVQPARVVSIELPKVSTLP